MRFQGKEVLVLRGPQHSHLLRPRHLRRPKPEGVLTWGSLITGRKVTSTSASPPPPPRRIWGGRSGWGLNHIRLGSTPLPCRLPPLPLQKQLAQPDRVPITAPQLVLIRVGLGIRPGPGDFLAQCHTPGWCPHWEAVQTYPTPMFGLQLKGPKAS